MLPYITTSENQNLRGTLPFSILCALAETPKATYWESGKAGSMGRSYVLALHILYILNEQVKRTGVHRVETIT